MLSRIEPKNYIDSENIAIRKNILCLHKLTDKFTYGSTNYSPKRLARLIEYLANTGFKFVSLNESLAAGEPTNLSITFDDGYAHLIHTLPPLMKQYRLKPTIFVPTEFIGKRNSWDYSSFLKNEPHLDRTQISELVAMGVEFGSHGHRHVDLTRCSVAVLKEELHKSKSILEDFSGQTVETLSYPFGRFNADIARSAKNAGYKQAMTMRFPSEGDSNHALGRIPIYFFDNPHFIEQKLNGTITRNVHQNLNRFINALSHGTTILNHLGGRTKY